jgi:Glyoxalase/Bleomycin resistance protein/Dioxygenase superfamily
MEDFPGNIVHFEHVNLKQPDQRLATIFYVSGLGLTRDPYMMTGIENMWINIGRNQLHLPTGPPQRLRGTIGLVVPDLITLKKRLDYVAPLLAETRFAFADDDGFVRVSCPWGNSFRCYAPSDKFGGIDLGLVYVEFNVPAGTADRIAAFYREIMGADVTAGVVRVGRHQHLLFRETNDAIPAYDGHHIQIYIDDFSRPFQRLKERNRITRETGVHEWRFRDIVDPETNAVLFEIEHEVRSVQHPLYRRPLVNRFFPAARI